MAVARLQCAFAADSLLARDYEVITPHFSVHEGIVYGAADWQALVDDLSASLSTWSAATREIRVTAYNAESPPPNAPLATKVRNTGLAPAASIPRQLALALSYYADLNRPKRRGRLYLPAHLLTSAPGGRPNTSQMQKVADLVPIFSGLGGVNVDWGVWSRRDRTFRKTSNYWVDDEWDVIRSRGLRPTTRIAGATSG